MKKSGKNILLLDKNFPPLYPKTECVSVRLVHEEKWQKYIIIRQEFPAALPEDRMRFCSYLQGKWVVCRKIFM
jgi:hypothetical protein